MSPTCVSFPPPGNPLSWSVLFISQSPADVSALDLDLNEGLMWARGFTVQRSNNLKRTLRNISLLKPLSDYCSGKCSFIASFGCVLRDWPSTRLLTIFSLLVTSLILILPNACAGLLQSSSSVLSQSILVFTPYITPALFPKHLPSRGECCGRLTSLFPLMRLERLNIRDKEERVNSEYRISRLGHEKNSIACNAKG